MPHAIIMDFPGGTTDDYDWVVDRMGLKGRLPAGALAHIAAPSGANARAWSVSSRQRSRCKTRMRLRVASSSAMPALASKARHAAAQRSG